MFGLILAGFAVAAAAPWVTRRAPRMAGWLLAVFPAAVLAWLAARIPEVAGGGVLLASQPWLPALGIELAFRLDGLSLLFGLLIAGLGVVVTIYAGTYLEDHPSLGRFFLALILFQAAMLGLVLADDAIVLFVFWELTSVSSFLLIGFDHDDAASRRAALQALLVTGLGGLALLAGLLLLRGATGSFALVLSPEQAAAVRDHGAYGAMLFLIVLGAFTKSAQAPFHFWLPNAMAAPTPVSAYLHSATMVKAGIYVLARLDASLGGTPAWTWWLTTAGAATMIVGAVGAIRQTDLKRVLAYSTVTALGTLTALLGLSFPGSVAAAMVFLLVHALYKGALFLAAGSAAHAAGTRDLRALGGLWRVMPITAGAALLAGLSMAGLPPLFGFIGKELTYKAKLGVEAAGWLLPAVAVTANALTAVAAGLVVLRPFAGRLRPTPSAPHEVPPALWMGPAALGLAGLLLGIDPGLIDRFIIAPASAAVLGQPSGVRLALWYGPTPALLLSLVTIALGVVVYLGWDALHPPLAAAARVARYGPDRLYDHLLDGTYAVAGALAGALQSGRLATYVFWIFGAFALLAAATLAGTTLPALPLDGAVYLDYVLVAIIAVGAVGAAVAPGRLPAIALVGTAGVGVAVLFATLGAPDLAATQFLTETLTLVLALLVVRELPRLPAGPRDGRRQARALLAVGVGAVMAALTAVVLAGALPLDLARFYTERAVPDGFGRNVVNVILVDFRALDTLGEITVLAVAALAGIALAGPARTDAGGAGHPSLILRAAARLLFPLLLIGAAILLVRGHNAPGGGFIAGLVAAGAFALRLAADGPAATRRTLRVTLTAFVGAGLLLALASGLPALAAGQPYLTGQWLGASGLGTPLLFDVGVFLVVLGFTVGVLLAREEA
jgi:multicomponent Na+:H+ antiporter subunit A